MESEIEISGRPVAVITGASSGIGYELAKVFGKNNFDLIVTAEDPGIFEAANIFRSLGVEVKVIQTDLATTDGVDSLYKEIEPHYSRLDSVALNAGVGIGGEFINTNLEEELNVINLNITSTVRLAKKILPEFVRRGHGRMLFTSSIAADMPGPYFAVYGASKAFVQSFSQALREEVKDKGVTITSLQPGATDTDFFAKAHMLDTKVANEKKDDPSVVAEHGFKALMDGEDHVVAGSFKNKVQSVVGKLMSEPAGAKMQARETKPGNVQH